MLFGLAPNKRTPPQAKVYCLSMVDIFQDLTMDEIKQVEHALPMTTCPAGKVFYSPNEAGEVIFILKKARVQLYRMPSEGRKLVIAMLAAGTVFGEMALIGQGMYDAFAEAAESSLLCIMNRRDFERLLLSKPKVAVRLLDLVGRRLREAQERLEQTLFHDVPNRLAALLLRLRAENGSDRIATTHEELAE